MIRKRDNYWQVKVYAGRDPLTGKERYEYDRARTKREAERVEAALKTKVAEGRHRSTAARTVADLVERWYEWRQVVEEVLAQPNQPGGKVLDLLMAAVGGRERTEPEWRALLADGGFALVGIRPCHSGSILQAVPG